MRTLIGLLLCTAGCSSAIAEQGIRPSSVVFETKTVTPGDCVTAELVDPANQFRRFDWPGLSPTNVRSLTVVTCGGDSGGGLLTNIPTVCRSEEAFLDVGVVILRCDPSMASTLTVSVGIEK